MTHNQPGKEGPEQISPNEHSRDDDERPSPSLSSRIEKDIEQVLVSDSSGIGVTLSGGLDSAAVLLSAARINSDMKLGRKIHCFELNMRSDQGEMVANRNRRFIENNPILDSIVMHSIDLDQVFDRPGPRYLGRMHRLAVPGFYAWADEVCRNIGVRSLLTGSGGDEIQAIRYLPSDLKNSLSAGKRATYVSLLAKNGPLARTNDRLLPAIVKLLPRGVQMPARDHLVSEYATRITKPPRGLRDELAIKLDEEMSIFFSGRQEFLLQHPMYTQPYYDLLLQYSENWCVEISDYVTLRSPFLAPAVVRAAADPHSMLEAISDRCDSSYLAVKGVQASLLSNADLTSMPQRKDTYSLELENYRQCRAVSKSGMKIFEKLLGFVPERKSLSTMEGNACDWLELAAG